MGKRLVIAEKPMLAKAILDAIPGTAKSVKAGERVYYTEKGEYLVVALAGHVLQLKEPEDYDPKYKKSVSYTHLSAYSKRPKSSSPMRRSRRQKRRTSLWSMSPRKISSMASL